MPTPQSLEIESRMLALRDETQVAGLSRFFRTGPGQYGEGDRFLGIKVPRTRGLVAEVWRGCSLADVEYLLASPYHEIRLCALLILVRLFKACRRDAEGQRAIVDFYLSHTGNINNWDLVDLSCYEILGAYLLGLGDRSVLYRLASRSATIWEQRIAIVSCMALVRAGEFSDCLGIADILLLHPHDLINKAVGWLLREVGKRDGALLREYLTGTEEGTGRARYLIMPRTALRYAIEKFPEPERQRFLRPDSCTDARA